jgi:hypothetical protein
MSERPEADKVEIPPKQSGTTSTISTSISVSPAEPLKTTEKPGTGTIEVKKDEPDGDDPGKGKSTFYGRDEYPDGYVMHHEQSGKITLTHPDGSSGAWNPDSRSWVDMAGRPMPEGWDGGHQPGTAFDSGKAAAGPQ